MKAPRFQWRAVLADGRAHDALVRSEATIWIRYTLPTVRAQGDAGKTAKLFRVSKGQTSIDGSNPAVVAIYGVVAGRVIRLDESTLDGGKAMVTARIPEAELDMLQELAASWKTSRTDAIRRLIREAYQRASFG